MAAKTARYVPTREVIHIEGVNDEILLMDRDHAYGPLELLRDVSVLSLGRAMRSVYSAYGYDITPGDPLYTYPRFRILWSLDTTEAFDDDLSLQDPVGLSLMRTGELLVEISVIGPKPRTEDDSWPEGEGLLVRWLESRRGRFVSMEVGEIGYRGYWVARFSVPYRGLTVADVRTLGMDAINLLDAHETGAPTLESLSALLRAGHAASLIGLSEGQLLEAKRQLNLTELKNKLELAKDVSAIANSKTGGLLVAGLETKRHKHADLIAKLHPFSDSGQVRNVRDALDRHIFPNIEGLQIELVPAHPDAAAPDKLLMIRVPPQPQELLPFLVTGVVVDDRILGNYIGLFERRGEDVVARSPAAIHAGLSTGLALLRRTTRAPESQGSTAAGSPVESNPDPATRTTR